MTTKLTRIIVMFITIAFVSCSSERDNDQSNLIAALASSFSDSQSRICSIDLTDLAAQYGSEVERFTSDLAAAVITDDQEFVSVFNKYRMLAIVENYRSFSMDHESKSDLNRLEFVGQIYSSSRTKVSDPDISINSSLETLWRQVNSLKTLSQRVAALRQNSQEFSNAEHLQRCVLLDISAVTYSRFQTALITVFSDDELFEKMLIDRPDLEPVLWELVSFRGFDRNFTRSALSYLLDDAHDGNIGLSKFARMRPSWGPYFANDPKKVDELLSIVNLEFSAMEKKLQTGTFKSLGEKIKIMHDIEQYGRRMGSKRNLLTHMESRESALEAGKKIWEQVHRIDQKNTTELKRMLEGREWFNDDVDGYGASYYAWSVAQHANSDPSFQLEALSKMEKAMALGHVRPSEYALLYDRVVLREKGLQLYGSQGGCIDGEWKMKPVKGPESLDERRKEMGLEPMMIYKRHFPCKSVSD